MRVCIRRDNKRCSIYSLFSSFSSANGAFSSVVVRLHTTSMVAFRCRKDNCCTLSGVNAVRRFVCILPICEKNYSEWREVAGTAKHFLASTESLGKSKQLSFHQPTMSTACLREVFDKYCLISRSRSSIATSCYYCTSTTSLTNGNPAGARCWLSYCKLLPVFTSVTLPERSGCNSTWPAHSYFKTFTTFYLILFCFCVFAPLYNHEGRPNGLSGLQNCKTIIGKITSSPNRLHSCCRTSAASCLVYTVADRSSF